MLKLGEAVRRLPEHFLRERAAQPTWRRAVGMRNRIAHEYDAIDYEIVWQVVSVHAADLRRDVESILTGDEGEPPPQVDLHPE
ncbi:MULTISPECIES: HepT-like ribonuclease domain-containing protein [unclassified Luteococcus]|uniref:HepT-like ribonuclease domain-containing protein n=1 Tax=unclassified Luteococcus TaxID=2639923 RepID=UPI00313CA230